MKNSVFGKTYENVKKHKDIIFVTIQKRINHHTSKVFIQLLLATKIRKTQILMNKPVCLGLSILNLSETVMFEIW